MAEDARQNIVKSAKLVVVKVGTRVLSRPDGTLDLDRVEHLADQIHQLTTNERKVVLVSSGAVGAGMSQLGMNRRPSDLALLQAVAAVGQTKLIEAYDRFFKRHGSHAAQVLLTAEDLNERNRYLNVRNTLRSLLDIGAIPIINENDTVAVEELQTTFGDNDRLAALVTNLLRAPVAVILSDVDGLYDRPPSDPNAKLISTVHHVDDQTMKLAGAHNSSVSKGGMASKLKAAHIATSSGENLIIANGFRQDVLLDIFSGADVGTLFLASERPLSPYKRWLGFSAQSRGEIHLDKGAVDAVVKKGRSILAVGVVRVEGHFEKGDVVTILDPANNACAQGLTNYSAGDLDRIKGLQSDKILEVLGYLPYATVVHRDNLMVTSST